MPHNYMLLLSVKIKYGSWRHGLAVKSAYCSSRGPEVSSHSLHWAVLITVTPVLALL